MASFLVALLAAAPVELSIGITPFQLIQMPEQMAGYAEDRLAIQLGQRGFKVTTPADMRALLGLERQKQLLGCESCSSDLASALGVTLLLVGRVSKLEDRFELDLRVIRQRDGVVVASDTRAGEGTEKKLAELVEGAAASLARQLEPKVPFAWKLFLPGSVGLVSAGVGAALWILAELDYATLTTSMASGVRFRGLEAIDGELRRLQLWRSLGIGGVIGGGVLIAAGVVLHLLWPPVPVSVVFAPTSTGGALVVGGRF